MISPERNGGFPEPPAGDPVRVVRAAHDACGAETRIRLPGYLPPRAVRRVVCDRCHEPFDASVATAPDPLAPEATAESRAPGATAESPAPGSDPEVPGRRPGFEGSDPSVAPAGGVRPPGSRASDPAPVGSDPARPPTPSRLVRYLGIPLAAIVVAGALILLQDSDDPSPTVTVGAPGTASAPEASEAQGGAGAAPGAAAEDSGARFVTQPGFSLALPPGWEQTPGEGGAAFTAAAVDGTADATLWIERAPDLSLAEFEARSLEQLRSLTGNAEVVDRIPAPTAAGTVVRLRADTPDGTGVSAPYDEA
jgi:hypothetical protein